MCASVLEFARISFFFFPSISNELEQGLGWGKSLKMNSADFASEMWLLHPSAGTPVCRHRLQVRLHSQWELAVAAQGLQYWRTFSGSLQTR